MIGGTGTGGNHGGPLLQCRKGVPPVPSVRFFDVRGGVTPAPTGKAALDHREFRNKTIPVCVSPPGAARAGLLHPDGASKQRWFSAISWAMCFVPYGYTSFVRS